MKNDIDISQRIREANTAHKHAEINQTQSQRKIIFALTGITITV